MTYNLCGRTKYFNDSIVYYNVKLNKVYAGCRYLCENKKLDYILIYKHEDGSYVGSYSSKYDNFKINGKYYKDF